MALRNRSAIGIACLLLFVLTSCEQDVDLQVQCLAMSSAHFPGTTIGGTAVVTDREDLPGFCRVQGTIDPNIGFEARFPLAGWNGKYYQSGCGGYCGTRESIAIAGSARINFGASVGHAWIRSALLEGQDALSGADEMVVRAIAEGGAGDMERPAFRAPLSGQQLEELRAHLEAGLDQGGLGIGMLLDYMSEVVDDAEMQIVFDVAAERQAPVFVHIRRGIVGDTAGLLEIIRYAAASGAPVHICPVQANAMGNIHESLRLIREARVDGINITTESFPYNAASTSNTAAVFNRDWRTIFDITYEDVEWAASGERFTEQTWYEYREKYPGGTIIHHYNKEEWTSVATNARVLGRYVRERASLKLTDAIAKMTYLPASVLDDYSPAMALKGRIQAGADADITIFEPETVIDNSTYRDPYQASSGIEHVIVAGAIVIRDGEMQEEAFPGPRVLR